jgi:hypothetical protein
MIELIEYLIAHFNLNEKFRIVFLIVLLCGLPVAMFIAWLVSREKETAESNPTGGEDMIDKSADRRPGGKLMRILRKPGYTLPGILVILLLLVFGIRYISLNAKIKWATERALPEIEQFLDEENYPAAFKLVQKAEKFISEDSNFKDLSYEATNILTILTDPPGADVYVRLYSDTVAEWGNLGKTPIDTIKVPNYTIYQMRIQKTGYQSTLAVVSTEFDTVSRKLFKEGTMTPGMVYVEGYSYEWPNDHFQDRNGFFMDQHEVTNKQFKEFVIHGGYSNPDYWKYEFIRDGKILTWEEAMAEFIDRTSRPGPATWEASDYPQGLDNYPVSNVS